MQSVDMKVSISPENAAELVIQQVVNGNISGELINKYTSNGQEDKSLVVLVFEKYYMRNSSRASLTVTLENLNAITRVHAVGSGGGQGAIFKFDWGASSEFSDQVTRALKEYAL